MPPVERIVPRFAAEPPQDPLPYGRWADTLRAEFLAACLRIDTEGVALGDPGELKWFPDRTWGGRTYVPVTSHTANGLELFGYVSFVLGEEEPGSFVADADFTDETADANPDWKLDLCDHEIGTWRGESGKAAVVTLINGVPMVPGAVIAVAELVMGAVGATVVDQCEIADGRFTLVGPDRYPYEDDHLEIVLYDKRGNELARESIYESDDDEDETVEEASQ